MALLIGCDTGSDEDGGTDAPACGPAASDAEVTLDGGTDAPARDPAARDAEVTLDLLVAGASNLNVLAQRSDPAFTAAMRSSHNPISIDPGVPGTWHANSDRGHYLRTEGSEHVLFDESGPGVITRIWSANPNGTIRIYVDDSLAIERDMKQFLSGETGPFVEPWSFTAAFGSNFYFPIPYGHSCKITSDANVALFYHVSFRTYEAGTTVESFSMASAERALCRNAASTDALKVAPMEDEQLEGTEQRIAEQSVEVGDALVLDAATFEHGGEIARLRVQSAALIPDTLRDMWLSLEFDEVETVAVPLIDFFGTGPDATEVASLVARVTSTGELVSYWPMPFARRAVVRVRNDGSAPVPLKVTVETRPQDAAGWNYFHASWHAPTSISTQEPQDWNAARLEGQGLLVGTVLNVTNPSPAWWGEGDERIYIDGNPQPSFAGTGTEDFFGYAWCSTVLYSTAYVGQTTATPDSNWGRISMYRWLVADPIPFSQSLAFDWEVLHWRRGADAVDVLLDATFFWYGDLNSQDVGASDGNDAQTRIPPLETMRPPPNRPGVSGNYRCY